MIPAAVNAVLGRMRDGRPWWERPLLQACFGAHARALGYATGPRSHPGEYAFLAADAAGQRRSLVWLRTGDAAVAVDFSLGSPPPAFDARAITGWKAQQATLLPSPRSAAAPDQHLRVIAFTRDGAAAPAPRLLWNLDLAGVQIAGRAALFHGEKEMARAAVYFDAEGRQPLKSLVTGLAPGSWEIWRNGYLEDNSATVAPEEGVLYFEGNAGSYFLRPLG